MKIVVDEKIPYIREAIERMADEVVYAAGSAFTPALVRDADALMVRTRTRCDERLLHGSRVRFIATATIGHDHIDADYCRRAGIDWANAPGCNSGSVAQYVESVLWLLQEERGRRLSEQTIGIVGVGNVGSKVARLAQSLGMRVLLNDPPRQEQEQDAHFCSLQQLCEECDILTFHVPLCREGKHATYHLADEAFFHSLKRRPVLLNTSRGEVVSGSALLRALERGEVADAVLDVWEEEPDIDLTLLNKVYIGTPHIAGYSADGKANATRMALDALCRHFGIRATYTITPPAPPVPVVRASTPAGAALCIYDPRTDSRLLKLHPEQFEQLRNNYPLRRERSAFTILT